MNNTTKAILRPFLAAFEKPAKPFITKVKALGNGYIVLANGLKIAAPKNKDVKTGDTIAVVGGRVI